MASLVFAAVCAPAFLPAAQAADEARGRMLYENHCGACHASVVHVREQRKARNPAELRAFIQRWAGELKLGWREDEIGDVQLYLNNLYYKFPPESAPR